MTGVRYWSAKARIGVDTTFDVNVMKNGSRLVTKLFNAGKFVLSHSGQKAEITNELDKAFIEELVQLVDKITNHFEDFDHASALSETETFFWNKFTDSYLELVKKRSLTDSDMEVDDKNSAVTTLRLGLETLLKLFAPFLPYITEEIWSWCFAGEYGIKSIHATKFPSVNDFNGINKPACENTYKTALLFLDEIKKYKSLNNLSYSSTISNISLKAHSGLLNIFKLVQSDIIDYARIEHIQIEEDNDMVGAVFL
jgi:valyl-tRNA synthetase